MIKINKQKIKYIKKFAFKKGNQEIADSIGINEKSVRNWKRKLFGYRIRKYKDFERIQKDLRPIKLSKIEWAYLAGLIDGEGSLYLESCKRKYTSLTPTFNLTNTNKKIVYHLKNVFCKGFVGRSNNVSEKEKEIYYYSKNGFGIRPIIKGIYPYLRIRKQQAKLLIEFIDDRLGQKWLEHYSNRQYQIYHELRVLNKRGKD